MNNINKDILKIVNKVKFKITLKVLLSNIIRGITLGIVACILITIISHLIPITFIYIKYISILLIGLLIGIIYTFINKPDNIYTAKIIDSTGLKERTVTALELMKGNNPYSLLELKDTYNHLQKINYKKIVSFKIERKRLLILLTLCISLVIINNIPNKNYDTVIEKEKIYTLKKDENKEIRKIEKQINNESYLTNEQKEKLVKELESLNKEISKITNEKEFIKQSKSNNKIIDYKKNTIKKDNFNKMINKMFENEQLKKLAQKLDNNNFDKAKEEIHKLKDIAQNMNEKEINDMLSDISKQLNGISAKDLENILDNLTDDIELTTQQLASSEYETTKTATNKKSGNKNMNDKQDTENSDDEQGDQPLQGNRNGEGMSKGSSNNNTNNQSIDVLAEDQYINGQQGKKNSTTQMTKEGISINGEKISYDQVIGEYESKAYESMNSSEIPKGMRQVIKEYFSGLN